MLPRIDTEPSPHPMAFHRGGEKSFRPPSLAALWHDAQAAARRTAPTRFDPFEIDPLPVAARRYLKHAIAPGTPLARAVRLRMHGEIRIGRWIPFRAEQVLLADRGMLWCARARRGPFLIRGYDAALGGRGAMRWSLFGLLPVLRADGPDITRSAYGRFHSELIWMPSRLLPSSGALWTFDDAANTEHTEVDVSCHGVASRLHLRFWEDGGLREIWLNRWGDPGGDDFAERPFSSRIEEERKFPVEGGAYTLPTRVRAGWGRLGEDFEDGEFFRAEIDEAVMC